MKKTLAAVAVLGAFAGSALAADVTLYGRVNAGLNYTNTETDYNGAAGKVDADKDSFALKSGDYTGSRWGIKGSEQVSENLTVGFQLENGFNVDDGSFGDDDRLFNREARVYAKTQFGEFGFGRMGGLDSGLGSYDMLGAYSAWGTGWGSSSGKMSRYFMGASSRYDNMITYKAPEFAGLTFEAQVSLKQDSASAAGLGTESEHTANRYYAAGLRGNYGDFQGALIYSVQDYACLDTVEKYNDDDGQTVTAWGSYDFGVAKVSLAGQYFDNVKQVRSVLDENSGKYEAGFDGNYGMTGYGIMLAAQAPVAGGNLYGHVGYADAEQSMAPAGEKEDSYEAWGVAVGYDYALSKRTKLYTAVSYSQETTNTEEPNAKDVDKTVTEVMAGLVHYF